jgi:DNA-binding transcriptional ArsR family regulator
MQQTFEITTSGHWKAIAHPLRVGILSLLQKAQLTNEEMAKQLGVESGKLYFHTKMLLTHGLIELVATRQKGPITEKLYAAVAKNYVAPPSTLSGDAPPFANMMTSALQLYRSTWAESIDPDEINQLGYHVVVRIP